MNTLNVGDKLYKMYGNNQVEIITIDRVTKCYAFSGATKLDRTSPSLIFYEAHRDIWSAVCYSLPTPEVEHGYKKTVARRRLQGIESKLPSLKLEQLEQVYEIVKDFLK